ncbi:MAG: GNAT family N-acetyltransferase [Sedimentisphaerales bacterium]|nr:GNAT family N-acetyltransferase [Sedimentisphaerales bacterium]
MEIRRVTSEDAEVIAKIHVSAWRIAYRGLVPDAHLAKLNDEKLAAWLREHWGERGEETYVAQQYGEVVGFVTMGGCRDEDVEQAAVGEIWAIYLLERHWRKGYGTQLCRYAESLFRQRGWRRAVLWVFGGNDESRRFYEAMGFRPDGATKMLQVGKALEAVRYWKEFIHHEDHDPASSLTTP